MALPATDGVLAQGRQELTLEANPPHRPPARAGWNGVLRLAVLLGCVCLAFQPLAAAAAGRRATVLTAADMSTSSDRSGLPEELTSIETSEVGVLKLWFERQRLLEQGDRAGAQEAVRRIRGLMEQGGIRGMENLAGALAHEGYQELGNSRPEAALASFELALRFDPTLPAAHFGLAHARRLVGGGFIGFLRDLVGGVRASMTNFWWSYIHLGNLILISLLAATAFSVTFILLLTARYSKAWRHGILEWLKRRNLSENPARFLSVALLVLPLMLWIGGPWLLIFWLVGTFRYMQGSEKGVAVAILFFGILVTPAFGLALSIYQMTANDTFRATVSAANGGYEPEKVKYIQSILELRPDDRTVRFLLASQLKDGGYFLESFQDYKKVLDVDPLSYRTFNNMGNIYFSTQQFGQSIHYYRRAIEVRSDFALGYFNTYLAQKELFHFTEAEQSLNQARAIDPEGVSVWLEGLDVEEAVLPLDSKISMSEVWLAMVSESTATTLRYPGSFVTSTGFVNPLSVASVTALVALLFIGFAFKQDPARSCDRCGTAFCRLCSDHSALAEMCMTCSLLVTRPRGTDPEARARKASQIKRYQWATGIFRRLTAMILPGTGYVLSGKTLRGLMLLLLWFFLGLHLLLAKQLLGSAGAAAASSGPGSSVLLFLLVAVWLTGNLMRFPKNQ